MLGNALEWTSSRFHLYPKSRFRPTQAMMDLRVLRGVSWRYEPRPIFNRYPVPGRWRRWKGVRPRAGRKAKPGIIGFRCAKDAPRGI